MAKVRGQDAVLYLTDDLFPAICARSITFDMTNEIIETSITGSGRYRTFKPGAIEWAGTIEGFSVIGVPDNIVIQNFYSFIEQGLPVRCRWYEVESTGEYYLQKEGYVIFESVNETSSFDNMVTFNASFKGTGPITITSDHV
jgi:hypothetical protein